MLIDHYPYWLEQNAQGEFCAHFRDFPDFVAKAPTLARLLGTLNDEFLNYCDTLVKNGAPMPLPSEVCPGEEKLWLKPTTVAKLLLAAYVRKENISVAELSRRLDVLPQEASRMLKLTHPTKIDTLNAALMSCGMVLRWELSTLDTAPAHTD